MKLSKIVASVATLVAVGVANAATDISDVADVQTDALAVCAALTTLGIAVWGANYVRRKFFR